MTPSNCLNCGAALDHSDKFCPACGQSAHTHRLSIGHLLHEVVHFFTHADKGIFTLIWQLILHPGKVAREYVAGKRKAYFSPLSFFLIVLGLYVFAFTVIRPFQADTAISNSYIESLKKLPPTAANKHAVVIAERRMKAVNFTSKYANVLNMVFVPVVALIFYLCYFRSRFNYTEHLVANMYAAGINALVFSLIIAPVTMIMNKGSKFYFMLIILFLIWEALYRAFLYYGFIQKKGVPGFLYALFVSLLVSWGWYKFTTVMIGWYIRTGWGT